MLARNPHHNSQTAPSAANAGAPEGHGSSAVLPRLGYSVAQAAHVTSISKAKLWELIKSGQLGSVKIAGRRIIRHSDLIALLNGEAI
jgi:excisionase family DNA binding protein